MLQFAAFPIPPNAGVVSKQMVNGMSDGKLARGATLFFGWSSSLPMGNSRQFDFEASTDFQFFVER